MISILPVSKIHKKCTMVCTKIHDFFLFETPLFFSSPRQEGGILKPSKHKNYKKKCHFLIRVELSPFWFVVHSDLGKGGVRYLGTI